MTENEYRVFNFIDEYLHKKGKSPTYKEIQSHFNFASIKSVQNYIAQLKKKGHIKSKPHLKRNLQINKTFQNETYSLPILGSVAAGLPLEKKDFNEFIDVPTYLTPHPDSSFVVRVSGDSMIEAGIFNNDLLLIESCDELRNGEIGIISTLDEEATVKYFYRKELGLIELRPANQNHQSQFYKAHEITVQGKVVGLIRSY